MCAVFGFLDHKGKISNAVLKRLIHYLSIAAEVRGTDATGIAYVRDGSMVTYKKPKPAHKVKLFFPRDTRAVIGHTRFTTQGSEKRNCNNHPFEGHCGTESFALAHNGVLYNDRELRREQHLPPTSIETDTYVSCAASGTGAATGHGKHQTHGRTCGGQLCFYNPQKRQYAVSGERQ
ncbi:MAG: class II glutamine amidotransferase [Ruminococcus sp.]